MDIIVLVAVALLQLVGLTLDQLRESIERLETAFVQQYAAQGAPALRFEVASVKRNQDGDVLPRNLSLVPGGVRVTNLPLSTILWMSHRVQADQVVEIPSWARSESFDIIGKAPAGVPLNMDNVGAMLRDLLADRFQLSTRRELRELPVYALVQQKAGSLGPRLKASGTDCLAGPPGGAPVAPPSTPPPPSACGATTRPGSISVRGFPLLTLARLVGPAVGRIVVDRTGLTGTWDLEVEFSADQSDGPSLFTALQEQVGLKLEAARAPVDVVVIERLERPTPD
jgi:uncharacterized protein (TIGR03435 family)